jgi:hypothetical protein
LDPSAPDVWGPGDLDRAFARLTHEPFLSDYQVQIWSSPPKGPWVITMENVISEKEAERLIELGGTIGYEPSLSDGNLLPTGETERLKSPTRTSMNAWQVFF